MSLPGQTSKEYFRTLAIIHYGLIGGQIAFGLVALYLVESEIMGENISDIRSTMIFVVPAAIGILFYGGKVFFRKRIRKILSMEKLIDKMTEYRMALFVQYGSLEAASLFSTIAYLLTGDIIFLSISGFLVMIFFALRPGPVKAAVDIELSYDDKDFISNPDSIISNDFGGE